MTVNNGIVFQGEKPHSVIECASGEDDGSYPVYIVGMPNNEQRVFFGPEDLIVEFSEFKRL